MIVKDRGVGGFWHTRRTHLPALFKVIPLPVHPNKPAIGQLNTLTHEHYPTTGDQPAQAPTAIDSRLKNRQVLAGIINGVGVFVKAGIEVRNEGSPKPVQNPVHGGYGLPMAEGGSQVVQNPYPLKGGIGVLWTTLSKHASRLRRNQSNGLPRVMKMKKVFCEGDNLTWLTISQFKPKKRRTEDRVRVRESGQQMSEEKPNR